MENEFRPLVSPCPAQICKDDKVMRNWSHANCGGQSQINTEAMVRCAIHVNLVHPIVTWRFACANHINQYLPADPIALAQAITIMRSVSDSKADRVWCNKLLKSIVKMMETQMKNDEDEERRMDGN